MTDSVSAPPELWPAAAALGPSGGFPRAGRRGDAAGGLEDAGDQDWAMERAVYMPPLYLAISHTTVFPRYAIPP